MRVLTLIVLVVSLAGCAPFGETKRAHRYFVLEPAIEAAPLPVRLGSVTASSFYDTEAIAYSRAPGTRGYYQLNSWTEPPARRIGELLARQVTDTGPVLNLHLIEMYHDAASAPGTARISMAAEIAGKGRKVFSSAVPAAAFDAAGAVKGFNEAVGRMMQEMATWIRSD